ncbi:penicillin acylase family protein [Calothrix sp. 336/3]|uniref:penicillin acylase family protein n=1 Tax=Calothrix sp. 336/3 TaxID=1337936 RepID=UPI000B06161B|nr:penicillin acylase family protein [Calothrix sp. 336/3]
MSVLLLTLICGGAIAKTIRQSFPQESGKITLPELTAAVEIHRDRWGIPHIYATNIHDLFLAQGYIHAQDRFWQMDFWRHVGSGRLGEIFGKSQLPTDRFLRTIGWGRVAKAEFSQLNTETQKILQAYTTGVNSYLEQHQNQALSLEYNILKFLNPGYKPEPWQPIHTLTWGKVMAYDLGDNLEVEIERSILLKTLTPQQVEDLFPPYPDNHPIVVSSKVSPTSNSKLSETIAFSPSPVPLHPSTTTLSPSLFSLSSHSPDMGIGSNNWVISGKLTNTGKPILANDPHLGVQIPSIWYEVGLHCTVKNAECPYDVAGFSFPGMAGVIIGHNDKIAWGVTNLEPDVMDLYIEKINPNNPLQYEFNGKWVDMQLVRENIQVAGEKTVTETVRYTRHGPIISDVYPKLKDFQKRFGIPLPKNAALSLRWTALEASNLASAIVKINRSQNWQEFQDGVKDFDVPAQNFVYADTDGNIGYQMPGKIPVRQGGNGLLPVPGWTDKFEWQGYIPFEKLPSLFNPESGYIVTANNAVIDKTYPDLISNEWDYGFRAQRIVEMITAKKQGLNFQDMQTIQTDNKNLIAVKIVPLLLKLKLSDVYLQKFQRILQKWDFQDNINSQGAAIFAAFWKHLLIDNFTGKLPLDYLPSGGSRWFTVIDNLSQQPESQWWDNPQTKNKETRDDIFRQALQGGVKELEATLGRNINKWRWGNLHTINFRNQSLGKSGVPPIEFLLNRGKFAVAGGNSIVNASNWNPKNDFTAESLASMRMIVDVNNWDNSLGMHTPGQSGHAFHRHYDDMIEPWRNFRYHPLGWQKAHIFKQAKSKLILQP